MKKIYSLLATALFTVTAFAQVTVFNATFDDLAGTGGNDGSWTGNVGTASISSYTAANWTFAASGGGAQCIKSGSGGTAASVATPVLTGLSGNATLTFRAGGFGTDNTTLTVSISGGGSISGTNSFALTNAAFSSYTVNIIGGTASSKLTFSSAAGGKRFFIDDIKVVTQSSLNVTDSNSLVKKFVKNTSIDNEIIFGAKSDIKIYNVNGTLVKTASVSENTTLNVAELPKGIYIVTGAVNGKNVSEKVIKK